MKGFLSAAAIGLSLLTCVSTDAATIHGGEHSPGAAATREGRPSAFTMALAPWREDPRPVAPAPRRTDRRTAQGTTPPVADAAARPRPGIALSSALPVLTLVLAGLAVAPGRRRTAC